MKKIIRKTMIAVLFYLVTAASVFAAPPVINPYISCGDNWFLGDSVAIDSPASIEAAFDMFKEVFNSKRIYWRGLQTISEQDQVIREDNFLYAGAFHWFDHLTKELHIEKMAVDIAHKKGLELWGVTQIGDYGVTIDTPNFNDFPGFWECKLREDHPEWIPVDKYGYRKQGGVIELAYPEARKALVDMYAAAVKNTGYDGIAFMTYAENFSMRFQDEFGYNEPVVSEFKKRYGIDIRTEKFNKFATREDWYRLRGEYVTLFLRELKEACAKQNLKIGVFLNPVNPRKPMIWATLNQEFYTLGMIQMDVDTWVRDGIVDELTVYGASSVQAQLKTLQDMIFLSRDTKTSVSFLTSNPQDMARWKKHYDAGRSCIVSLGEDPGYFSRSTIPVQEASALEHGSLYEKMRYLGQVADGKSVCPASTVIPLLKHENVMMRRMALFALKKIGDVSAVAEVEKALNDPELGVRCVAVFTLGSINRPESLQAILQAIGTAETGSFPMIQMARSAIPRFKPFPYDGLTASLSNPNPLVRRTAMYALHCAPRETDIPLLEKALNDPDRFTRYLAAKGFASLPTSTAAHEILIRQLKHADAAIADRIAVSIGDIVRSGYKGPLRVQMLNGLKTLFLEMGENCKRPDKDWGYRSIGNALLAFGKEGETLLRELKDSPDRRISELAWRVLSFREKAGDNEFNIITEEKNDELFRQRPVHLKTITIKRIVQDFEDTGIFNEKCAVTVGDGSKLGGRWMGFTDKGALIERTVAHSGRQSLKLVRGGNSIVGWGNNAGITAGNDYAVSMWVYRIKDSSFCAGTRDTSTTDDTSIFVMGDGKINIYDFSKSAWKATELIFPSDKWVKLIISTMASGGTYTVSYEDENGKNISTGECLAMGSSGTVDRIILSPIAPDNSTVYFDDISLLEVR